MGRKLNIALLTCEYLPKMGGWSTYTFNLALALKRRGHNLMILAPRYPESRSSANVKELGGLNVIRVFKPPTMKLKRDLYYAFLSLPKVFNLPLSEVDLIHVTAEYVSGFIGSILSCKKPFIITSYGTYSMPKSLWEKVLLKWIFNRSFKIIAISEYTAREIVKRVCIDASKITIIPGGVDTSLFNVTINGNIVRGRLNIKDKPVLLSVGRLVPRKGFEFSLKAFKKVLEKFPSAVYIIIGDGPQREHLHNLARELGISHSVMFLGSIDRHLLPYYYAACDLFLLTPQRIGDHYEGLGLVYLEAAACGKPLVGTRTGGASEAIINGINGFIVEPKDIEGIAKAVINLLEDENLRRTMGERGYKRIKETLEWDRIAERVEKLYYEALER